jgi:hypothetical protein
MLRTAAAVTLLLLAAPTLARAGTPAAPADPGEPFPSLLGGETLRGSSVALATGGFASLGAAYAQGLTSVDDLGGFGQVNWTTSELVLGAFWHHQLGRAGGWDVASRLSLGWYLDGGATLIYDDNRSDRGLQVVPGLAFSSRGVGLLAVALDLPLTLTTWRGGGTWVSPRVTVSYEAPLYDRVALGVRGSLAWRGGTGGAPMRAGQVLPELVVTATWRLY